MTAEDLSAARQPAAGSAETADHLPLFTLENFDDFIDAADLDGTSGWYIYKLYRLREGAPVAASAAKFLEERPDVQYCLKAGWADRFIKSMLSEPTYLLVGTEEAAKAFSHEAPELAEACKAERIHVIGGEYTGFWDCFNGARHVITVDEYPGSADDAATYGYVKLD